MANVVAFSTLSSRRKQNAKIVENKQQSDLLKQAFAELKAQTGIDHYEVLKGNQKEIQRKNFRQYQEALLEG
ncbi:hypothetical protein [Gottfriedia solisilvae]|uniref:hypothetical protein n=1 Tax=Gottfriedia solisilvae TaxID=1516104 RepID=UPI003D2F0443